MNIRLGYTKKKYSNGKVYYVDAKVEGIKYYSQKNPSWSSKKCSVAPYNGIIQENGCMLSSLAMINSKYSENLNPGQLLAKGIDCNLDYNKAAGILGYKVQNTYSTKKYTRYANASFYNSKKYIKNNKSTFSLKEAIYTHTPVQVWLTPNKRLHRGHSVVAYRYIYNNGRWDIKIYDPYTPGSPSRSLKDVASRHYIVKGQVWIK